MKYFSIRLSLLLDNSIEIMKMSVEDRRKWLEDNREILQKKVIEAKPEIQNILKDELINAENYFDVFYRGIYENINDE